MKSHATLDEAISLDAAEYVCLLVSRAKSNKRPFPLLEIEAVIREAMQKGRRIGHLPITGVENRKAKFNNR